MTHLLSYECFHCSQRISFLIFFFEYVLFYQFYARITSFFDEEKFGTAPPLCVDVEKFGGNWRENDAKTSKMTSKRPKSAYWRHAWESPYTPHVRRHFLAPIGFTEIQVGYARRGVSIGVPLYLMLYSFVFAAQLITRVRLPMGNKDR